MKDTPLNIRLDYRQDKLGYKLTLRLVRQSDGEQSDFGDAVGTFTPAAEVKPANASKTSTDVNSRRMKQEPGKTSPSSPLRCWS